MHEQKGLAHAVCNLTLPSRKGGLVSCTNNRTRLSSSVSKSRLICKQERKCVGRSARKANNDKQEQQMESKQTEGNLQKKLYSVN
eukprot:1157677-Pelagomonas_calceolata.AAC.4